MQGKDQLAPGKVGERSDADWGRFYPVHSNAVQIHFEKYTLENRVPGQHNV